MTDLLRSIIQDAWPFWLISLIASLITITIIMLAAVGTMMLMVWLERRVVARMQDRLGPNRVGPAGLLQSIADGVKMFTKEDIVPRAADQWVHMLAPIVVVSPVVLIFAVVPWGRGVSPSDFGNGVLFVLAISSISAIGLMMAGWSSSNKFAMLGAMRAVAQLISYEIPAVLALLSAVIVSGSMQLARMPELQGGWPLVGTTLGGPDLGLGWFVFTPVGLVGFVIFFIAILAEGERTPFDIPEADSEIVARHTTEYSGMKFALFYIGQYVLNFVLSMVATVVFLGGWQGPLLAQLAIGNLAPLGGLLSLVYMLIKVWGLFFVMIWLRGALPRLRVDQLMDFAWKLLLPIALINLFSAALWVTINLWGSSPAWTIKVIIPVVSIDLLGWLETASPIVRQITALIVTAALNIAAIRWVLAINRRTEDEEPEEAMLDVLEQRVA
ncbi:MAG: NADH-quinone oxidoreductase subunit NuoH [Roseiflexaceae bacterium]|nr:NADH-quinone oxidoreductase subunit NuoH [Roseiflexaceae bacterium]